MWHPSATALILISFLAPLFWLDFIIMAFLRTKGARMAGAENGFTAWLFGSLTPSPLRLLLTGLVMFTFEVAFIVTLFKLDLGWPEGFAIDVVGLQAIAHFFFAAKNSLEMTRYRHQIWPR